MGAHASECFSVEEVIPGLAELDRVQLVRVPAALRRRLRILGEVAPIGGAGEERSVSGVVEYHLHTDGTLQKEVRRHYRKDGTLKEQGPYWYFRYQEGGKQKILYLGKPSDPDGELDRRVRR